jgi:hypothetical protein
MAKWLQWLTLNHLLLTNGIESYQGFWIFTYEEAIQQDYRRLLVPFRNTPVSKIMHKGALLKSLFSTTKAWKLPYDLYIIGVTWDPKKQTYSNIFCPCFAFFAPFDCQAQFCCPLGFCYWYLKGWNLWILFFTIDIILGLIFFLCLFLWKVFSSIY